MKNQKIVFVFLLLISVCANAVVWEYELSDALIEMVDIRGNKTHSANMQVIDYYVKRISHYAKEYPSRFKDENEKKEVIQKLKELLEILEIMAEDQQNNPDFLDMAAFVNSMGYNVDIKGTGEKTVFYYKKLLDIMPDNPTANYNLGVFLSGTRTQHFESITYLEKALKLGRDDARYSLGLLYYQLGEKDKGISMLKKYSSDNPNNRRVKKVIEAMISNNLKYESS